MPLDKDTIFMVQQGNQLYQTTLEKIAEWIRNNPLPFEEEETDATD